MIEPQDARLFAAAVASDPALEDDVTAARAEQAAVSAMGEALGRPSMRPLLALFAAIEAGSEPVASNIVKLTFAHPRAKSAFGADIDHDLTPKKFSRRR